MWDFLTFKTLITRDVLILAYYTGAVVMPLVLWASRHYLIRWLSVARSADALRQKLFSSLSSRNQLLVVAALVAMFLMMELAWRMMFETMIAYFQMHDYLQLIASPIRPAS